MCGGAHLAPDGALLSCPPSPATLCYRWLHESIPRQLGGLWPPRVAAASVLPALHMFRQAGGSFTQAPLWAQGRWSLLKLGGQVPHPVYLAIASR